MPKILSGAVTLLIGFQCMLLAAPPSRAQDLAGKRITFRTKYLDYTLRVLKGGHILISTSGMDCRTEGGGETGGEAIIGQTMSISFTCTSGGVKSQYTLNSTASYSGGVLDIVERWSSGVTQRTVLKIDGSRCSGTVGIEQIGESDPVSDCVVR